MKHVTMVALLLLAGTSTARAESLSDVQTKLEQAMTAWSELQDQRIDVKRIEGLGSSQGAQGTKQQLEERLKTLLTKKRSNREWDDYWASEARLVTEISGYYEKLAPKDPASGRGLAEGSLGTLIERRDRAAAAVKAAEASQRNNAADVAAAVRWLELKLKSGAEATKTAAATERKLRRAVEAAENALKKLTLGEGDGDAPDQEALSAAQNRVKTAQTALADHLAQIQAQTALAVVMAGLKAGDPMTAETLPKGLSAEALKRIEVAIDAPRKVSEVLAELKRANAQLAAASKDLAAATGAAQRFRERRAALDQWAALARKKQANQDKYYAAIDADIAAVEERLRGIAGRREMDAIGTSEKVCLAPKAAGQTSLQRYTACKEATQAELRALEAAIEDAEAARKLNELQIAALELLLAAQIVDEALVRTERKIAASEVDRAAASAVEMKDWRDIWKGYTKRAKEKAETLREALRSSKDTQRQLNVNVAFYSSELSTLKGQKVSLEAALEARTSFSGLAAAVVKTAWEYLKRAYMVPIYLLIAWLLLRLSGRVEAQVVAKARENQHDRDAVQRVETLSTVARGAVRLVVYIATLLMCLVAINVDIGPLLGGAAIFGLAISFGSQSLVKDVVTGFFILLEDQYAVGDSISTGGISGTVEKVTLRRTVLRDLKGAVHHVPNGSITTVSNMSQGWARVVIEIGVAYGTDLERVREVVDGLGDAMYAEPEWSDKLLEAPRYIGMTKFDASSIVFRLMFRTEQLENWGAEREFNRRLHNAFDEAGIEIPYDRVDVSIVGASPEVAKPEAEAAPTS